MDSEALFARERSTFHADLLRRSVLTVNPHGIASNADSNQQTSRRYALHIAKSLNARTVERRLPGQTAGERFEQACADFLSATFLALSHLRPGNWTVKKIPSRGAAAGVAFYEQYKHLVELNLAVKENPALQTIIGNDYAIAPDVIISRAPVTDGEINAQQRLVDDTVAKRTALRLSNQRHSILHAVISCKWTLRTDRAQNARSEALNLIRNRKGRLPHVAVVTGEPTPTRISSLALGTGDIDCVYHFALPELVAAVEADGDGDSEELLGTMISGNRLKDIADLPLDLAV